MYAPNIKEIDITGNISTKSYSLGKCFPKAKYIYLYDTNVGKSGTLDGFQDIETLFISGKKVTDIDWKLKKLKSVNWIGHLFAKQN